MKREIQNTFSWSVSRDSLFQECLRKYYFQHYGFWSGWEMDAQERTRQIYVLRQLMNRWMWVGHVVHECIAHSLKNLSRGIPVLPVDEVIAITRQRMRKDFRDSRAGRYWDGPKHFCGLFEHEYGLEISDAQWREAADTVDRCLRHFYGSSVFQTLGAAAPEDFLEIEQLSSFLLDGVNVNIRLDCATWERGKLIVWDWKTGRKESESGLSVQMACYAEYAREKFRVPLERIVTRRYDLYRDRIHEHTITEKGLQEILSYIRGSIKDMVSLLDDAESNRATEERFRKVEKREICLKCSFFRVCKPDIEL
jgi:hypothetical protein